MSFFTAHRITAIIVLVAAAAWVITGEFSAVGSQEVKPAEGEAAAIKKVFGAVHEANPDEKVLAYQYLQQLPAIANGTASKVWVIPAELSGAAEQIVKAFKK